MRRLALLPLAVLLLAAAPVDTPPVNGPRPSAGPDATPGYAEADSRAARYKNDARAESFRADVLMPAVLSKLSDVLDKCRPDNTSRNFTMVFSYRAGRFDRIELSDATPLARCMAEAFKQQVAWPVSPIPDMAASSTFHFTDGPPPDDVPGEASPGYDAARARADRYETDPKAEAFRKSVLAPLLKQQLGEVTLPKCVPKGLVMKFTLVISYKAGRLDAIETSKNTAVARCVIAGLKTGPAWPQPPFADYASYIELNLNPPRSPGGN